MTPKDYGGGRPLGIPTIRDRVSQMATKIVMEPIFEADFFYCSYGFRPKRSAHQVIDVIAENLCQGYTQVIPAKKACKAIRARLPALKARDRVLDSPEDLISTRRSTLGYQRFLSRMPLCRVWPVQSPRDDGTNGKKSAGLMMKNIGNPRA